MSLVLREGENGVVLLRLNRPEKANALNGALLTELRREIADSLSDSSTKVLILSGAGDRFSTGADLNELLTEDQRFDQLTALFDEILRMLQGATCLTASFVNGACTGGGFGIALSTDFVLVHEEVTAGTPEITRGLFPFVISPCLKRKLGLHRSMALMFGGKLLKGKELLQNGIASEWCLKQDFETRCSDLIQLWQRVPKRILQQGKHALLNAETASSEELRRELSLAVKEIKGRK